MIDTILFYDWIHSFILWNALPLFDIRASLIAQLVKNLPVMQETQDSYLGQEDPLEKEMAVHSSILAGECHGQRSLAGYSPRGRKSRTQLSD